MTPTIPTGRRLWAALNHAGVKLSAHAGKLRFDAPAGTMTPELLAMLSARKAELLAIIAGDYLAAAMALVASINAPDHRAAMAEWFAERAAIREYDGGMIRPHAERLAYINLAAAVEGRTL